MSEIVKSILLFLGCSLIGWIFVGVALHTRRYQQKKELEERTLTTGTIVDMVKKVNRAGRGRPVKYYVPVVAFEVNGHTYRLENENGLRKKDKIIIGKSVDILYDENDPTRFHLAEDDANEKSSESLLRLGVILIAVFAVLTVLNYFYHLF